MVSKKIYIVRHGQTDYNKNGIVQGRGINASLNEVGNKQGQAFFDYYKEEGFEAVFTSSLIRTQESVKGFMDSGLPTTSYEGLDEISWGSYDGTVLADFPKYWEICKAWTKGEVALKAMDGESPEDVQNRQLPVIEEMKNIDVSKLLVCMHGRAIRILLCEMLGKELFKMDEFKHHNLGLYVLNFDGEKFELEMYNSIDHLKSYPTLLEG